VTEHVIDTQSIKQGNDYLPARVSKNSIKLYFLRTGRHRRLVYQGLSAQKPMANRESLSRVLPMVLLHWPLHMYTWVLAFVGMFVIIHSVLVYKISEKDG
jgi:hypothetical protein